MQTLPFSENLVPLITVHQHFNSDPEMANRFKIFTLDKCCKCGKKVVKLDCFKVVGVEFVRLKELGLKPHKWIDVTSLFMGVSVLDGTRYGIECGKH